MVLARPSSIPQKGDADRIRLGNRVSSDPSGVIEVGGTKINKPPIFGRIAKWPKADDSRSFLVGVRRFESCCAHPTIVRRNAPVFCSVPRR